MIQKIDGIKFKIKEPFDFGFLSDYGKVFKVFDDQDSGNICFGTERDEQKYFIKFAGAKTAEYGGEPCDAVSRLKATVPIYENLRHKNLIEYMDSKEIGKGFAMIFKWADGECMGRMYPESHRRFMSLSNDVKLKVFDDILDFMKYIAEQNFVAIDFYDSSIMYDFENQKTIICDIDFFRKLPAVNDMGRMWGSSVFMSPEEFKMGAVIDEVTNVYTLGAMAFALFGNYKRDITAWSLNEKLYYTALKAVNDDRNKRHQSVCEFIADWENAMLENNDKRIEYYELLLEQDIESIKEYLLPEGFHYELYKDGDRDDWIEIEKSAKEFEAFDEGISAWNRYYNGRENELYNRMVFVVNESGEKVGTATAFYEINGKDKSGSGWLHWVAVKKEFQGIGLSKPLITHTLCIMKELGYTHAKIPTQTNTWLAVKIYLDLGFKPIPQNAVHSYNGWRIIKEITGHKMLDSFI